MLTNIDIIYLIILIPLVYLSRILPRLYLPLAITHDSYYHLLWAKEIKRITYSIPKYHPNTYFKEQYDYPFLYHLFLSLFNDSNRLKAERATGAIFDAINFIIFFSFYKYYQQSFQLYSSEFSIAAYLTLSIIIFSPIILRLGYGPRAFNGSARVFGQTLYFLHLFATVVYFNNGNIFYLIVSIVACSTQFFTSKFSLQVLVFFSLFLCFAFGFKYLAIIAISFLFAVVITKGHVIKIFRSQLTNMSFYLRILQKRFVQKDENFNKTFSRYWLSCKHHLKMFVTFKISYADFKKWYYSEPYFLHILITCFPFIFVFVLYLFNYDFWIYFSDKSSFLLCWALAGIFWFLITKIEAFLFIGEAERYLEYAIFPIAFCTLLFAFQSTLPINILNYYFIILTSFLIYSLYSYFHFLNEYRKNYKSLHDGYFESQKILIELNKHEVGNILPISAFWQSLYFSNFPTITLVHGFDGKVITEKVFLDIFEQYPYPNLNIAYLTEEYNIKYLFGDKGSINVYLKKIEDANYILPYTVILQSDNYVVYKLIK